jgi:hypothetical protein
LVATKFKMMRLSHAHKASPTWSLPSLKSFKEKTTEATTAT